MSYFPVFLDIRGRACLVVGGGEVAARKAASLLAAGARVRLVAERLEPSCAAMGRAGQIRILRRRFRDSDLDGCALAVAATDDAVVNRAVRRGAARRSIPCNVVDQPALCSFIFPAVVRRGALVVAVSTGGASPAVARRLRRDIEKAIGPAYGSFLTLMREARQRLARRVADPLSRKRAVYRLVSSPVLDLVRAGRKREARRLAEQITADAAARGPAPGRATPPGRLEPGRRPPSRTGARTRKRTSRREAE